MRAGLLSLATGVCTFGWLVALDVVVWRLPLGDIGALIVFGLTLCALPLSLIVGLRVFRHASGRYRMQQELIIEDEHPQGLNPTHQIRTSMF